MRKLTKKDIPSLAPGTVLYPIIDAQFTIGDTYVVVSNDNISDGIRYLIVEHYDKRGELLCDDVILCGSITCFGVHDKDEVFLNNLYANS